jgi:hypothetical protein
LHGLTLKVWLPQVTCKEMAVKVGDVNSVWRDRAGLRFIDGKIFTRD